MRSPQSADDNFVIAECVIQVESNPPQVDTTDVGDWGSRVDRTGARKERDDLERLLEFFREDLRMVAVLKAPSLLSVDMPLGRQAERILLPVMPCEGGQLPPTRRDPGATRARESQNHSKTAGVPPRFWTEGSEVQILSPRPTVPLRFATRLQRIPRKAPFTGRLFVFSNKADAVARLSRSLGALDSGPRSRRRPIGRSHRGLPSAWFPAACAGKCRVSRYFPVMTKCPRRFSDQHPSFDSSQNRASLPRLTVTIRLGLTPRLSRYCFTIEARCSPSARLYSADPRSSQ
jgi:hypothetical protein